MIKPLSGFQKSAQLANARGEKLAELRAKIVPLDPEFPYSAESYDPAFFRIPANPTPAVTE